MSERNPWWMFSYLVCVIKGHKAFCLFPMNQVNTFNFCRRCGQRVRSYHTPVHWYEVDKGEKDVSPLY